MIFKICFSFPDPMMHEFNEFAEFVFAFWIRFYKIRIRRIKNSFSKYYEFEFGFVFASENSKIRIRIREFAWIRLINSYWKHVSINKFHVFKNLKIVEVIFMIHEKLRNKQTNISNISVLFFETIKKIQFTCCDFEMNCN